MTKISLHLALYLVMILLVLGLVSAAEYSATVGYTLPTKVVYNIPFIVTVNVDSSSQPFIDYDFTIGSVDNKVIFESGVTERAGFDLVTSLSGPQDSNKNYRVRTKTNGETYTGPAIFNLNKVLFKGIANNKDKFVLKSGPQKTLTHATTGNSFTTITSSPSEELVPAISDCGDGVLGYDDVNDNGIFESSTEVIEYCDDARVVGGCSNTCDYVELTYDCGSTVNSAKNQEGFGYVKTVCTEMPPKDLLLKKLTALINGVCLNGDFVEVAGASYNCNARGDVAIAYANNKLTVAQKVEMVKEMAIALHEFFDAVVVTSTQ